MKTLIVLFALMASNSYANSAYRIITKISSSKVSSVTCVQNTTTFTIRKEELSNNDYEIHTTLLSSKQLLIKDNRLLMTCDNVRVDYRSN